MNTLTLLIRFEKEYAEIESQERSQQSEISQLRNENRRLQLLVEKLENETSSLADQLVSRQIQCAELAEETSALKHAVASARKLLVEHNVLTVSCVLFILLLPFIKTKQQNILSLKVRISSEEDYV